MLYQRTVQPLELYERGTGLTSWARFLPQQTVERGSTITRTVFLWNRMTCEEAFVEDRKQTSSCFSWMPRGRWQRVTAFQL